MIRITSNFDSGNIRVLDYQSPDDIRLEIVRDNGSDFYQWFYFRVMGARGEALKLKIGNAGGASYPKGWENYRAVASVDLEFWERLETAYDGQTLTISVTPETDSLYIAYFSPYPMDRHTLLIASTLERPGVHLSVPGETLDGQPIEILEFDAPDEPSGERRPVWITARQHPGETMAEWWMEGFLARLTDPDDPVARAVRNRAALYVVPNMNPDGSRRGHLRTNARGVNLNREWNKASLENSPEVFHVLGVMEKTGIDLALDVHGDEALPYNFIAGAEGIPGFSLDDQHALDSFKTTLKRLSPDFQTEHGYPVGKPGKADLSICTNYLAHRFKCLAMTLEMPFKDTADNPDPDTGWSPERCRKLGAACLSAIHESL